MCVLMIASADFLEFSLDPVLTLGGNWDKLYCVCVYEMEVGEVECV